jgi:hypothetical protein
MVVTVEPLVIVIAVVRVPANVPTAFAAAPPGVMVNVVELLVITIGLLVVRGTAVNVAAAVCGVPPGVTVNTFVPLVIVIPGLVRAGTAVNAAAAVCAVPPGVMVKVFPPLVNEIEVVYNAAPVNVPVELAGVALVLRLRVFEPTFTDMELLLDVGPLANVPICVAGVGALASKVTEPMVTVEVLVAPLLETAPIWVADSPAPEYRLLKAMMEACPSWPPVRLELAWETPFRYML